MMKKTTLLLTILLLLTPLALAQLQHYYKIEIQYTNGELTTKAITIEPSTEKLTNRGAGYVAELISFNDITLETIDFSIPLLLFYDNIDPETGRIVGGGSRELEETIVTIYVPYHDNAKEIVISDLDHNKKLTIDVTSYAKEITGAEEIVSEDLVETVSEELQKQVQPIEQKPVLKITLGVLLGIGIIAILITLIILLKRNK